MQFLYLSHTSSKFRFNNLMHNNQILQPYFSILLLTLCTYIYLLLLSRNLRKIEETTYIFLERSRRDISKISYILFTVFEKIGCKDVFIFKLDYFENGKHSMLLHNPYYIYRRNISSRPFQKCINVVTSIFVVISI